MGNVPDRASIAPVASIARDASTLQRPKERSTAKPGPSRRSMRSASMSATSAGPPRSTASNQWFAATGTKVNLDMDGSARRLARTPGMRVTFPEIVLSTSRLGNWSRQQGQSGNSALVVAPRVGADRADVPQERLKARGAARAPMESSNATTGHASRQPPKTHDKDQISSVSITFGVRTSTPGKPATSSSAVWARIGKVL